MKPLIFAALSLASVSASAQYYYNDIIGTKETTDLIKTYKASRVSKVTLNSFDAANNQNEDFFVEQNFDPAARKLTTLTRSGQTSSSVLTSFLDEAGNVIQTVDSSETSVSTTHYRYDASGKLLSLSTWSRDTSGLPSEAEEHIWQYQGDKPVSMLRIKDKKDTTQVTLRQDAAGNIIEEQSEHKGLKSEPVYYYYNNDRRLTDIVRYNNRAKRLLPDYMFEYSPSGQVIQKITVPANSSDYLIWRYQYDNHGLRIKEAIFNKRKQLTGKIEYHYQFAG